MDWKKAALYSNLGFQIVVSVALGVWAGQWLDRRFAMAPVFLIFGFVLGVTVSAFTVWQIIKQLNNHESK